MQGSRIIRTPDQRLTASEAAALRAVENQQRVTPFPYYSKVRWALETSDARPGPFGYQLAAGSVRRAFSYGVGDLGTPGGFVGLFMTAADTNLTQANQTIGGESVQIDGIAVQVIHGCYDNLFSDTRLLMQLQGNVSVDLSVNGDQNRHHLGVLSMVPGAGGIRGTGIDQLGPQQIEGGRYGLGAINNGWETRSNFFRCPDGIVWRPQGHADSMLNVIFTAERDINLYSGGDVYNPLGDEAAAAGIRGYLYPLIVAVEVMVLLVGRVVGPRTTVA